MRTTLTIDDDILAAAKSLAQAQGKSIGDVVSDLARRALQRPAPPAEEDGIPLLPISNPRAVITLEHVNSLRDELP